MPSPRARLGDNPSHICRDSSFFQDSHTRCTGAWQARRGIFRREVVKCTCSCHNPPPTEAPKGPSGVSRRSLDDWYGVRRKLQQDLADNLGVPVELLRSEIGPNGGILPAGWSIPEPDVPESIVPLRRDGGIRGIRPALAWIDEMAGLAPKPYSESFAVRANGEGVAETLRVDDEANYDMLVVGRAAGKGAAAEKWRRKVLDSMEETGGGIIATIISKATMQLAKQQLEEREVQIARAFAAGMGLAVIRGPIQEICEGDSLSLRLEDLYLPHKGIPAGVVYDFPSREAFDAWEERNDG